MIELDVWREPVQWIITALALIFVYKQDMPLPLKLFVMYFFGRSIWIGFHPNFEAPLMPAVSDYVRMGVLHASLMVIFYWQVLFKSEKFKKYFVPLSVVYFLVEMLWLIHAQVEDRMFASNAGFMTASTQSVAMMACFLPLYLGSSAIFFLIPFIGLLIFFKAATAAVVLVAMGLVWLWTKRYYWYTFLAVVFGAAFALEYKANDFLNPGARLMMWKKYIYFWDHTQAWRYGLGFGAWDAFSRFIKVYLPTHPHDPDRVYFLFHNDWLQMLVEGGIVGLFLALSVGIWMYRRALTVEVKCAIAGFSTMMCFYSPLRFAIGQMFLVYLVANVYGQDREV